MFNRIECSLIYELINKFVSETDGRLKIFYLPPYSPELNPDELVWNYLKNHHTGRMSHGGKNEFHERVISIMQSLQQLKDKSGDSSGTLSSNTHSECSVIYALVNNVLLNSAPCK